MSKEPRLRIVLSPEGIERVELWGINSADRDVVEQLYYGLTDPIRKLSEACRSISVKTICSRSGVSKSLTFAGSNGSERTY
jgi:hypothetical protein